jgi:hypothetical protein
MATTAIAGANAGNGGGAHVLCTADLSETLHALAALTQAIEGVFRRGAACQAWLARADAAGAAARALPAAEPPLLGSLRAGGGGGGRAHHLGGAPPAPPATPPPPAPATPPSRLRCPNDACALAARAGVAQPPLSYAEWAASAGKPRAAPVAHLWGAALRQIEGVSGAVAAALARAYATPRALLSAYGRLRDAAREGPALLADVPLGAAGGRRVGPAVSRRVFEVVWEGNEAGEAPALDDAPEDCDFDIDW